MKTSFTDYWQANVGICPQLDEPNFKFVLTADEIKSAMREAFEHGVVHHAAVMKQLNAEAKKESRLAHDRIVGPESLRPEFEEIFGPGGRGVGARRAS